MKKKLQYLIFAVLLFLLILIVYLRTSSVWTEIAHRLLCGNPRLLTPFLVHHRAASAAAVLSAAATLLLWVAARRFPLFGGHGSMPAGVFHDRRPSIRHLNLALLLLIVLAAVYCIRIRDNCFSHARTLQNVRDLIRESRIIVHAGGNASDAEGEIIDLSNCKEAFTKSVESGQRIIELDIRFTSDNHLVCLHNWQKITSAQGHPFKEAATLEEFKAGTVMGRFTTMTMDEVAAVMREHPDMYLITDFKSEFRLVVSELARLYPDLIDRFIIQVYHGKQYAQAWNAGFHNVILTLYKAKDEELSEQHLSTFAADKMLVGFTVEKELLAENTSLKDALLNTGVPVYAHTVDDPDERDMLFQEGITAVYTDNLY